MFGGLIPIITGLFCIHKWGIDERNEQQDRENSRKNDLPYYYDKYGKMRWVSNKKKMTYQEILDMNMTNSQTREQEKEDFLEKSALDRMKRNYDMFVIHKDNISFEEYVAVYSPSVFFKNYKAFARIKNSVSQERIDEIRKKPIKFG